MTQPELTHEVRAKRVAIARDVIERLNLQALNVERAAYLYGEMTVPPGDLSTVDLKEHVDQVEENCQVCFLGALLLSKARLYDAVPMTTVMKTPRASTSRVSFPLNGATASTTSPTPSIP